MTAWMYKKVYKFFWGRSTCKVASSATHVYCMCSLRNSGMCSNHGHLLRIINWPSILIEKSSCALRCVLKSCSASCTFRRSFNRLWLLCLAFEGPSFDDCLLLIVIRFLKRWLFCLVYISKVVQKLWMLCSYFVAGPAADIQQRREDSRFLRRSRSFQSLLDIEWSRRSLLTCKHSSTLHSR